MNNFDRNRFVYLDYPATTPCDQRVFAQMEPYFCEQFGNPHSAHELGNLAQDALENARSQLCTYLKAEPHQIFFTSGATEANTLALRGHMMANRLKGQKNHLVTTLTEHKSVLSCCTQLREEGFKVTYLPVSIDGTVDLSELEHSITDDTAMVSIATVNNETGVIQPLEQIGAICLRRNVIFHTDATQAIGKMPLDLQACNIALASFSAHKVYGPKGVGALFCRKKFAVRATQPGGGQEMHLRGGTVPVPLCVGFGEAIKILSEEGDDDNARIRGLSARLLLGLQVNDPVLHGAPRVPHILNMAFPGVEGESVMMRLKNVCVSTGSACSSEDLSPSHVLKAMRVPDYLLQSSIRFGIGRFTTPEEVDYAIERVAEVVQQLRELSPLWDLIQRGEDLTKIAWRDSGRTGVDQ
jgi:cysteine desulfurase